MFYFIFEKSEDFSFGFRKIEEFDRKKHTAANDGKMPPKCRQMRRPELDSGLMNDVLNPN